ncbi:hypothetical protein M430DRAFT_226855 [Amorphotheca resinae ATCC 22711]|uniref:Copper-fist domain-containing protein n=1 Tax=Amorphotheca resinae ATCC 22711 TaxID=857342 RepID=A0A2T3B6Y9_AMORE|nr:hypothetical protein M430DRAFT_226855 [Amorphotheca resinae ATCC 22711]PSS22535.1 hypothetical protein M430DRAFT_226855 [Amorphotheca resinae ATCC 22711]
MPIINGIKYSCEPCIRGHRATSCAHPDRILVEVRKPGRPLQSCGHKLDTCVCGRLAEAFKIGDILPKPANQHPVKEPGLVIEASTNPRSGPSSGKSKPRRTDQSKVAKRTKTKPTSGQVTNHARLQEEIHQSELLSTVSPSSYSMEGRKGLEDVSIAANVPSSWRDSVSA